MNNLTAREKGFMYVITLLIIVVLGYFFGIRTLNNKYDEYKVQLQTLEDRKAQLDQMRINNDSMAREIKYLKEQISDLELSFIDKLETECIEQYVLKTFETEGCPFLTNCTATDVGMSGVSYPDGSASPDGLVCMQVTVTYVSTDGYTVTQYNRNPDFTPGSENPAIQNVTKVKTDMGKEPYNERKGYNEFISALKKINAENPKCIKVDSIDASTADGYMKLTAQISFYGTSLTNRISVDNSTAPYTSWSGSTNIDTAGGFIGFPYVCDKEESLWYGVENPDIQITASKPFASYYANYVFKKNYQNSGNNIKKLIGFGKKNVEDAAAAAAANDASKNAGKDAKKKAA